MSNHQEVAAKVVPVVWGIGLTFMLLIMVSIWVLERSLEDIASSLHVIAADIHSAKENK